MYLVTMDQPAREDIAAAAAVHQELGRDYDDAVAEGLIERIGAEIDKRVDARLGQRGDRLMPRPRGPGGQLSPSARPSWAVITLGLGSMGIGIGAASIVLRAGRDIGPGGITTTVSSAQVALVVIIWLIIGVINVAYARRR
jgi:hypothetical protein